MDERNDREQRHPAEGVRIIGADEAQAALDAGAAEGRRREDELRFGDVPPAPSGPRPQHRFPLPESVDPAAAVPRPPVVAPVREGDRSRGRAVRPTPETGADPAEPGREGQQEDPPDEEYDRWAAFAAGDQSAASAGRASPYDLADPGGPTDTAGAASPPEPAAEDPFPWTRATAGTGSAPKSTREAERTFLSTGATGEPGPDVAGRDPRPAGGDPSTSFPSAEDTTGERNVAPAPPGGDHFARPAGGADPPQATASPSSGAAGTGDTTGERITFAASSGAELPHWTDPPTGEVPRILAGDVPARDDDDLGAWQSFGSRGQRWRDEAGDWDDVEELQSLGSEETRVGALDTTRAEHSDLYSFDAEFERLEEERSGSHPAVVLTDRSQQEAAPAGHRRGQPRPDLRAPRDRRPDGAGDPRPRSPRPPSGSGSGMTGRVGIGVGLVALLLVLYFVGPLALLALSAVVVGGAAAEGYGMLQRAGFRPATLLGLVASVAIVLAGYWRGAPALPVIISLTLVVSMLWYLLGIVEARPLANVAVTNLMFLWAGVLGSYSALMLRAPNGRGLFLGAVVTAVGADIVAYFGGRHMGSRHMAPVVSPGKTWEGATLGFLAAVVIGAIVGHSLSPWGGIKHGILLGIVVGVLAPIGDLAESMVKRDLGIKDSGTALGGHGGLLDRFDSVLFVLPAAYYLASFSHILK